jgi:thiol-disulfide isomerase/thioredoxin
MPIKINKNSIIAIIAVVVILGGAAFCYLYNKKPKASLQKTAEKAIDFVNKNLLSGGVTASLDGATSTSGVFQIGLKIGDQIYNSYVTEDGKIFFPEGYEMKDTTTTSNATTSNSSATVGNFITKGEEVCKENGKPIIYFFGSKSCPHCQWEHPIVEKVLKNFEGLVSFHNNMDSQADSEIFSQYSDGGIPTLVFGCKYYKLGSGESEGEATETKNLTAVLCKLTDNKPSEICSAVQDLVNQIK